MIKVQNEQSEVQNLNNEENNLMLSNKINFSQSC